MLHKLDLTTSPEPETAEPVTEQTVDETAWNTDNRSVLGDSPVTTTTRKPSTYMKKPSIGLVAALCFVAIAAGVGTGFGSYKLFAGSSINTGVPANGELQQVATGAVKEGEVFGSADESAFKDHAKGYLEKGGVDGEGSHKLIRIGGDSQTVYLTSSVTDLDKFDGMEVEIWGETFSGQKAGWLMDVGRVKITKVKGENPSVE